MLDNLSFLVQVRWFRKNLGMTQAELGKTVGVSRVTIYNIEKGVFFPKLDLCFKICVALGVSFFECFIPYGISDEHVNVIFGKF